MTHDDQATVIVEKSGAIARIVLNRPEKLNAIDFPTGNRLYEAFIACKDDPEVRAIVLAGTGRAFCAGDDLGRSQNEDEERSRRRGSIQHYATGPGRWTTIVNLMHTIAQPIVARIQGYAYGAGFNLALGADFRVMADDALLSTPFTKRGIATGTNQLQQFVGIGKALELTLLGEPIDAATALDLNLVTEVVPPDTLDDAVEALATRLAAGPTAALALTKTTVYSSWRDDVSDAFWKQGAAVIQSDDFEDRIEGGAAFREKRPPRFVGR